MEPLALANCLIALCMVLLNGFFVLVEFALVRARATQLLLLREERPGPAALALAMRERMDRYLAASQLGITIASLGLGWIGEPAFAALLVPLLRPLGHLSDHVSHAVSFGAAFCLITAFHIVVGEQVPKYIAICRSERSLLATARAMRCAYVLLYLPMMLLNGVSNWIVRRLGLPDVTDAETVFSKEELRLVLSDSHSGGAMSLTKVLLCENVLDLSDCTARGIMIPLDQVAMLDLKKPWPENRAVILARRYSRYPLCDGHPTRIVGFVHFKEMMLTQMQSGGDVDLAGRRRNLPTVDADMHLEALLPAIQRFPTNMALVTDRAGAPLGIVTFEDVLEEIVGEIADEFEHERVWRLGEHMAREALVTALRGPDLAGAVRELAGLLTAVHKGLDTEGVIRRVLQRENEMSTAVGEGVALPHARIENLPRTLIAYGRRAEGIACAAFDGKPVRHVFLILTPMDRPREQLRALARISGIAQSDVLIRKLDEAPSPAELAEVFRAADAFLPL